MFYFLVWAPPNVNLIWKAYFLTYLMTFLNILTENIETEKMKKKNIYFNFCAMPQKYRNTRSLVHKNLI